LKSISFSPSRSDSLFFDTIWAEDTNHVMKIYTFENVISDTSFGGFYDTTKQLFFARTSSPTGTSAVWEKIGNNIIASCPEGPISDTTYSSEICFKYPIISNGHVKIRIKANKF
jgi:hypothetical protein